MQALADGARAVFSRGVIVDEHTLIDRQLLSGMAAAGATGILGSVVRGAAAAETDPGIAQPPTITDVKGKAVYVTGGASGIGLGIARVFHEAGTKVVIGYLDEQHIGDALKHFPATIRACMRSSTTSWIGRLGARRAGDRKEIRRTADPGEGRRCRLGGPRQAPALTRIGNGAWASISGVRLWHSHLRPPDARQQAGGAINHHLDQWRPSGQRCGNLHRLEYRGRGPMEELRQELRNTNIGTSCFIPGLPRRTSATVKVIVRPRVKNDGPPALAPGRAAAAARRRSSPAAPASERSGCRPGGRPAHGSPGGARFVLNGILNNDLYIVAEPQYRLGVEARCNALLESMVPFKPLPAVPMGDHPHRQRPTARRSHTAKRHRLARSAVLPRPGNEQQSGRLPSWIQPA